MYLNFKVHIGLNITHCITHAYPGKLVLGNINLHTKTEIGYLALSITKI